MLSLLLYLCQISQTFSLSLFLVKLCQLNSVHDLQFWHLLKTTPGEDFGFDLPICRNMLDSQSMPSLTKFGLLYFVTDLILVQIQSSSGLFVLYFMHVFLLVTLFLPSGLLLRWLLHHQQDPVRDLLGRLVTKCFFSVSISAPYEYGRMLWPII